jgi:acetylornithine deacetylase/succinyl-diaminopimelate desuccinylase-like protein
MALNQQFKKLLTEYVALKSISTDPAYKAEMVKTADWLMDYLKQFGFKTQLIRYGAEMNDVVFAEYTADPTFETVLVYGHYDVQPASKSDGWDSEPFDLVEKNGKLIARGVVDNKGQNLIHVFTVCELIRDGKLGYNVKFMIEGNEETSSPDMPFLVEKYKDLLKADYIMVSDGEIVGSTPTLEASLRGGFNFKITLTTAKNNMHSGLAGGVAPSAAHELSRLIAKLYDSKNKVTVPGFYDGVPKITADELRNTKKTGTEAEVKKLLGIKGLVSEKGLNPYAQIGLRPTLQVTGIKTGYIGDGYSNIIPATAEARINIRLVGSQKPKKIYKTITSYIKKLLPTYVSVVFEETTMNDPVKLDISKPKFVEVRNMLKKAYKKEPLIKYVGGSIPIVADFKTVLGRDTLLVSLGNDDCNMHGVHENYRIDLIEKGLAFSRMFFEKK